jgi:hypothetical protein
MALIAEIERLRAERDELLAALRMIADSRGYPDALREPEALREIARAAIAKAEGRDE